ncbi:Uncharacterised protein [Klebsiella pneumoniae]|nr:Uncharacterised protein [Klebsiella pneumoniae]
MNGSGRGRAGILFSTLVVSDKPLVIARRRYQASALVLSLMAKIERDIDNHVLLAANHPAPSELNQDIDGF